MIEPTHDLTGRLQRRIWLLGVFVAGISSLIVLVGSEQQEDRFFQIQAELTLEKYLERYPEVLEGADLPLLDSSWFSICRGEDGLPVEYRERARSLPPGTHELHPRAVHPEDYVLVVKEMGPGQPRLYLLYDVRELNQLDELVYSGWPLFLAVGGVSIMLALLLTISATKRFFAPVSGLVETIEGISEPGDLVAEFDRTQGENQKDPQEVRQLRRNLRKSMARIDRLVQREREFSRNASHELRTPLTVIRSAAELLAREVESPSAKRRVEGIERAAVELQGVVDTFQCLAREELPPTSDHPVDLEQIARSVVDTNRHLLDRREVEVQLRFSQPVKLAASEQIVSILLSNLVRNAFASTQSGTIDVAADSRGVRVLDTGPGVPSDAELPSKGGVGLLIVQDLCTRLGWTFSLHNREHSAGAVAELTWPASALFGPLHEHSSTG